MNSRERYVACLNFEPVDRPPLWELGYWAGTLRRWYTEGLPKRVGVPEHLPDGQGMPGGAAWWDENRPRDHDVRAYLGFDEGIRRVPVNILMCPQFTPEVLEDHGHWFLWRDENGLIKRDNKSKDTLPDFVRGPVQTRDDWERVKAERLQPNVANRLPANWPQLVEEFKRRDYPLAVGAIQGFFGTPRNLLGVERVLTAYYDDPEMMEDMTSHLADLWITIYAEIFKDVVPDVAFIWEDMCYKTAPLISPAMFRRFMLPHYKRFTAFLKESGVRVVITDTDGNLWPLIPLFVEGGVTALYPFECMAGMDVVDVRKAFPRMGILGGIDKTKLAEGKEAIDRELEAKLPFMFSQGGYIPFTDHQVPPDVSWENFVYYRRRLGQMIAGDSRGSA